ncbi:mitochondrial import inner membrane translocase subunit tim54, partial [Peltigera leucophlebia]|nr:mitochondrial import inner membrane translocase subunit tim54 [Peltigera leucophlebia]
MPEKAGAAVESLPTLKKPTQNPAFRMMGIPRLKLKLPSRNWLIFLSITGSFTTAFLYDRQQKKKAQQRWCNLVSHMANEPLPTNFMPRRITIFLSPPPGDGLRVAREHFHEYIKPILVAGALDWEVIEGRREGEVRAGLAEKIRRTRKRDYEAPQLEAAPESRHDGQDLVEELRQKGGIKEWNGLQGDLVLGRHTWKEYIRGLHEGWLGPLDPPSPPDSVSPITRPEDHRGSQEPESTSETVSADSASESQHSTEPQESIPDPLDPPPPPPAKKPSPIP